MDLSDAPDEARFRQDLRAWLEKSLPELPWPEPADLVEKAPFWRRWQAMLFEAGYAGLTWPREYGGQGLDERMRAIFGEECDRAGAPERLNTIGEDFAGPTIAHFGSQAQKQRFLRPILTGEEIWCQLFSEPDSGSDLASLRTKAMKVEDGWRIQGQKIWTSRAQLAAHAILLARTGGGPRHKGSARPSSTRSSSMTCSCPTTRWSARSTGAGRWPWERWPSSESLSRPAG